jgi:uncharacterized phage protein (TIGR02218 family)
MSEALHAHLDTGVTLVARCWAVVRRDGAIFGFTDHDRDLAFEGVVFRAGTGLTARAVSLTTGLSVDNSEAAGALSDAAVTEADIAAGRFDGAAVTCWLVRWDDVAARKVLFRGSLGQIERAGGAFRAELRGLSEALNVPQGRTLQRGCAAVLGDASCRFDLTQPGYAAEVAVEVAEGGRVFRWAGFTGFDDRWFERGRFTVVTGAAAGLVAVVKNDRLSGVARTVELWEPLAGVAVGDVVRIEAGCDKRADTCRLKFGNFPNFRGFPHVPGEDWLASYPVRTGRNDGGSLVG